MGLLRGGADSFLLIGADVSGPCWVIAPRESPGECGALPSRAIGPSSGIRDFSDFISRSTPRKSASSAQSSSTSGGEPIDRSAELYGGLRPQRSLSRAV